MPVDLVVRLGVGHSKWLVVLRGWEGDAYLDTKLLAAINAHLKEKYAERAVTEFDHIEVLGYDRQPRSTPSQVVDGRIKERNAILAVLNSELAARKACISPDSESAQPEIEASLLQGLIDNLVELVAEQDRKATTNTKG